MQFIELSRKHVDEEVGSVLKWMEKGGPLHRKTSAKEQERVPHSTLLTPLDGFPWAVLGYSMMVRGDSFRADVRLPTHMVNAMSNATSLDRLVQSAGERRSKGWSSCAPTASRASPYS